MLQIQVAIDSQFMNQSNTQAEGQNYRKGLLVLCISLY